MELIKTFFLATFIAFVAFLIPGMINMTIVKIAIEQSKKKAFKFISGTLLTIGIQVSIATIFSKFLSENKRIEEWMTYIGIVIFVVLAILFYRQAKLNKPIKGITNGDFFSGMKLAAMNMLVIPFFLGYSTAMEKSGVIENKMPNTAFFIVGAVFGSFIMFTIYLFLADFIEKRANFIARNINYILSFIFLVLTIITITKLYN